MLRSFRFVLFPFSILYAAAIWVRNKMFDRNILQSASFNFPVICIGNLAIGGTGKTPMTEYLIRLLKDSYKVATLSRGYKRKTKGFAIATNNTTALDIGDEPMQFHLKYPAVTVAVAEERLVAIPQLLHERPETEVIILDDAFQHRYVRAGLNILLTEYKNLYTRDFVLPAGDLRDIKMSSKRADIIVVTKCPVDLSNEKRLQIIKELNPEKHQTVFFTAITYGSLYHITTHQANSLKEEMQVLLVCGIANPKPLKDLLAEICDTYDMIRYPDHHIFTIDDLKDIKDQFTKLDGPEKIILTTEKDSVRLLKFEKELDGMPVYVLPMEHIILFNEQESFQELILSFIQNFPK